MLKAEQKYIAFYDVDSHCEFAIVFPRWLNHNDMARAISQAGNRSYRKLYPRAVSAGFCTISPTGAVQAYGVSESLSLKARAGDAELIRVGERVGLATDEPAPSPEQPLQREAVKAVNPRHNPEASKASALRSRFKGRR